MTAEQLRAGKLEQTCPDCRRWEAAGSYCTGCSRPTGPEDWYLNGDLRERTARGAVRDTHPRRAGASPTPHKQGPNGPGRTSPPSAAA